jgi:hypothetical protein
VSFTHKERSNHEQREEIQEAASNHIGAGIQGCLAFEILRRVARSAGATTRVQTGGFVGLPGAFKVVCGGQ